MRHLTLSISLLSALALACAGPTPVERHWGEAQRNSTEAMIAAAKGQPGPGLDGGGATAAYGSYTKALETPGAGDTPEAMFGTVESD